MAKLMKKSSTMVGLAPGTLIHIGERKIETVKTTLINYNETEYREREVKKIEECFPFHVNSAVTWINIDGIHDTKMIEKIGNHLKLHPLLLEDIMDTHQRPKIEDYGDHLFIVLKMLYHNEKNNGLEIEQVSLVLGPNYVISF